MCTLCFAAVALCISAGCTPANAQEAQTQVVVKVPPVTAAHEFDRAEVSVNGQRQIASPGSAAHFDLPAKAGDTVQVQVRLVSPGFGVKQWEQSIQLSGSGHVDYVATLTGNGVFGQWPLVVFKGSIPLDVWVDRTIKGTTEVSKGISPDDGHIFEWKSGDSVVCRCEVSLPVNVRRTYRCNATTKKVEQP
jgi:hypothetical protein